MTSEALVILFDALGIYDHRGAPNRHKTLNDGGVLPSLYFNGNRDAVIGRIGETRLSVVARFRRQVANNTTMSE